MQIQVRVECAPQGRDGTPIRTEVLADGMRRHTLSDGQVYEEDGPRFRLEYLSYMPKTTYSRDIAIFGVAERKQLFEAWCYACGALRTYAFIKVVAVEDLATGQRYSGEGLREALGGEPPSPRP